VAESPRVSRRDFLRFGVHRTAYHVLRSVAKMQPGEEVVVLGAGGGVGLAAVLIAHLLGALVGEGQTVGKVVITIVSR
jgi:NADPH:quinone reductase